jgi:tetratricopeptide (TPR) repeat protein
MTDQERDALFAEAEKLRIAGDYEGAQPKYAEIAAEFPDDGEAHTGLGHCLLNTGMFEESLDAFKRAVELEPESVKFLLNYGKTLCMLGEYDDAKAQFEKVLSIDPDNDDAMEQMLYFPE